MTEADWMRVWQNNTPTPTDPEKVARAIMAQTWKFDQKIFWRNAREYAAGLVLLVIYAVQLVMGHDRTGALIGIASVGFVMFYLWWKHRGLQPLDPAADVASYKASLMTRYDDQIRLLRSVPYWYLLPLCFLPVWTFSHSLSRHPIGSFVVLLIVFATFAFVAWLNVVWGVRTLRAKRDKIASMSAME